MIQQIDVGLDFDYDAESKKIINLTFDDSQYKQVQFQCAVIENPRHGSDFDASINEPCRQALLQALELQYGCEYCTKPVSKLFGDKAITVCLGLEKL